MPLFVLPEENNEHANFEWRGGEGCGFFCSLKSSYNNFVANCRKSVPFTWRKMSLQKKVTDIKIMTDIFPGPKILCPRNGGIPWIEVPKRRDSTVIFNILFKFRSSLRKKKLLLWRHLVIQVWYTGYNSLYHNWVSCSNTRKYCNLIGSYQ